MDPKYTTDKATTAAVLEQAPADLDEPPESNSQHINFWLPQKPQPHNAYAKTVPPAYMRRESLLTRQIHSETEHSDDEPITSPIRGLSMVSTWSNPSTGSTAELTSDDGRSASPGISPALPPTATSTVLPVAEKPLITEPSILGLDSVVVKDPVEAGLGRKRCITFACGNKAATIEKPVATPAAAEAPAATSPPKRKCALKFVCPSKPSTESQAPATPVKPPKSPGLLHRRSSSSLKQQQIKVHRGSDSSTVLASPKSPRMLLRKNPLAIDRRASPKPVTTKVPPPPAQLDNSDESGAEATRFHEFATSEEEPDDWIQESTCHRNRLCVTDTLKKENVIRQLGQEVEDEVLAEEEEDEIDEEEELEDEEIDDDDDAVIAEDEDDDDESDDGFKSDDEHGFAVSDSDEAEDSDNEWWTPGGPSTAATSAEHLEHLTRISAQPQPTEYASSLASMSSNVSPHRRPRVRRNHSKTAALDIGRPETPDLPDSTDFVCGTLDEDRPQEQAYIDAMKERENAGKKIRPQDIDPSFPASDPEMDEEDDEDIEDPEASSGEEIMHGSLDSIHGTARRILPAAARRASVKQKSPAPAAIRHKSPAPTTIRHKSPAPRAKSPAPKARTRLASPAPMARAKSPAPKARRPSPAPKKLFGQSPRRARSPAPSNNRMTSPPNTRRASPMSMFPAAASGLAGRPNTLTIASSLPKRTKTYYNHHVSSSDVEGEQTPTAHTRRRGAIDIVKGLEKKKQRRREKLAQKLAAKAAARGGEERKKIKPGRGAERMREVGLELQKYKGRAGHILSY